MNIDKEKDIYNEFLKMGYSEKDSLILTRLAIDTALAFNGYVDISEVVSTLVNMFKKDK